MPNQKSRLAVKTRKLTSIQLKTSKELTSYFAHFNSIIAKLNSNPQFTIPKGVHETLLLKGLSLDYKTVATVIGMTNNTSNISTQGMLCQHKSELQARKQAKKEQAILFTAAQQSIQALLSSSLPVAPSKPH